MCIGSYGLGELVAFFASNKREGCTIPFDNEFHTYIIENGHQQIDDKVTNITTSTMPDTQTLLLFKGSTDWDPPPNFEQKQKIKYYKIYENDTLIQDFIPVVDNNGVACLYDNVSGQMFYNEGSGEFIKGPKIEEPVPPEPETPDTPTPPTPKPPKPVEPTYRTGNIGLQIGANSGRDNQMDIDLAFDLDDFSADVTSVDKAAETLEKVDALKKLLSDKRSEAGAQRNRLDSVISAGLIRKENLGSSYSTIVDTDFASETTKLTKQQILQQASASLLSQANIVPNIALQLLT